MVISLGKIIRTLKLITVFIVLCICMNQLVGWLKHWTEPGLAPLYSTESEVLAGGYGPSGEDVGLKQRLMLYYWLGE